MVDLKANDLWKLFIKIRNKFLYKVGRKKMLLAKKKENV